MVLYSTTFNPIVRETEKAYLVTFCKRVSETVTESREEWLPKSQVKLIEEGADLYNLLVTPWILTQKGLDTENWELAPSALHSPLPLKKPAQPTHKVILTEEVHVIQQGGHDIAEYADGSLEIVLISDSRKSLFEGTLEDCNRWTGANWESYRYH